MPDHGGLPQLALRKLEPVRGKERADSRPTKGALRCLKRHLARRFWQLLTEPPLEQHTTTFPAQPEIPPRPTPRRQIDHTITGPIPIVCIT
ncbi:MAG: hypothetical protein ACTHQQ_16930 [Solirubrobacteraceae bacterium]